MTTQIAREKTRCHHIGYSFRLAAGFFYIHHPTDRIIHTTAFCTPITEHWLEREIAQWVHPMKDRSDDPSHHERTLLPRSYISLQLAFKVEIWIKESQFCLFLNVICCQLIFLFCFWCNLFKLPSQTNVNFETVHPFSSKNSTSEIRDIP